MSIQVCYTGPISDASGYGEATRNFIMALREAGADIKVQKISFTGKTIYKTRAAKIAEELSTRKNEYKIKIIHTTPDIYKTYREVGKYNIGHLFWETSRLPTSWVAECNKMNEIWTGTELNAKVIRSSGVTVPIFLTPEPIDTDESLTDVRPYIIPNFQGVLFYSIFDWNERKNPRVLLDAFWKEFKGQTDVGLLIKTHKGTYSEDGVVEIISQINRWKNELGWKDTPRTFINTNILNEEEKHRLHETGDCYVSTSRGEGWNIPMAEAALHKKPIISTKNGGLPEYFTSKHFWQIYHSDIEIDKVYNKYYEPGMTWADANEKQLRELLRKLYENLADEKRKRIPKIKAAHAYNVVAKEFNYKEIGSLMMSRLAEIERAL